jgi:CDP-diacylglycerol--glycerol-3-phosphate 3-phosphatidyltransferase
MYLNIPNILTLLRISLIPIFVLIFYLPFEGHHLFSAIIFAIAAATDWLDGYLARKLKQVSPLGEFLDPVADKLIVAVALVLLVQSYPKAWLAIASAVIVSREIVISALREWMAELGKRQQVAVKGLGKFKTAGQMVAITVLLSQDPAVTNSFSLFALWIGSILLYAAALLTLWSMVIYLKAAWQDLTR